MAGEANKLVAKLARRARWTKKRQLGNFDRENKLEAVLAGSPAAYKLMRKSERQLDSNFGIEDVGQKPVLAFVAQAATLARVSSHMQLTLPAEASPSTSALSSDIGIQVGDVIEILQGHLAGQELLVTAIINPTTIQMEDRPSYSGPESDIEFRALLSNVKASFA
jgi:hypothetical protein